MAQLAIKGHGTRGKEVIELLEMLGGNNPDKLIANFDYLGFFIGKETRNIYATHLPRFDSEKVIIYTLEEFLKKFPYKVGDKVSSKYLKNYKIEKMEWEDTNNRVIYKLQGMGWYNTSELQPYKEEAMEETETIIPTAEINLNHPVYEGRNEIELIIPDGWKFEQRDNKMFGIRKQLQYPKTYEECYKILNMSQDYTCHNNVGYKWELITSLQKLLICRDAYWKIAGEQMGLGKPWEPIYTDDTIKYSINIHKNKLVFNGTIERNYVLIFPTKEIKSAFYENFKELIETCKELL